MKTTLKDQIIDIMMDGRDHDWKELADKLDSSQSKSDDFGKVVRAEIHTLKEEGIVEEGDAEHTWRLHADEF